jgi:hypothetical protein
MRRVALALLLLAAPARAETERCTAAYDATQRLRQSGKLRDAQNEALVCADAACPRVLRQDCARWVDEIQRATPTIVVHAVGADGCDVVEAKVTVDGAVVAQRLEGTPLALDPGVHVLSVGPGLEQRVVVVEGDHDRRVELSAAPAGTTCGAARPVAPPPPHDALPQPEERPTPTVVYVLGAVGLASLTGGAIVAATGLSKKSDLDQCKPGCNPDDVSSMRRTFVVSDILIGIGVVSLATAAYFYFARPARRSAIARDLGLIRFSPPLVLLF